MKNHISIYKQYVRFLVLIPILILVISVVTGYVTYKIAKIDRQLTYFIAAEKVSTTIERSFNYILKFSEIVGDKILSGNNMSPEFIGEVLQKAYSVAQIGQDVATLTKFDFVTPEGYVIANVTDGTLKNPPIVKKSDREWMILAPKDPWKLHVTADPVKGIVGKGKITDYGIPAGFGITDERGNFLGIVSSGVDIDKLTNKIKQEIKDDNLQFLILTKEFKFVASSNSKINNNSNFVPISSLVSKNHLPLLNDNIEYNGITYSVYQYVDDYPFIVLIGENTYLVEKEFRKRVLLPLIMSSSIGVLLFILFAFFRNRLVLPVKELSDIASSISRGEINVIIPEYTSEEVSSLANQIRQVKNYTKEIHSIKSQLEKTASDLEQSNNILEQKVLERTYELEQALSAKTEFLNNMSHEIRTPILGFTNISEELVNHWQDFDESKRLELAGQVASNAKRLSRLVVHLLDLSKFAAGKMLLEYRKIDLNELVEAIIDEAKALYLDGKALKFEFTRSIPAKIIVDEERIAQVLRNLVVNAVKFSNNNSTITAQLTNSLITYDGKKQEAIHFAITDLGIGIPKDELEAIFTPFFISTRTKTKAGGTGLGLAITREIIEAHHGRIWAENNQMGGATFSFVLPIFQTKELDGHKNKIVAENDTQIINEPVSQKPATILMVDDDEICLTSMEMVFYGTYYKLIKAGGGREALEYLSLNQGTVDLIMLDLMMPDMYGLNVLSTLKSDPVLKYIPVILQTGISEEEEIKKAYEMGVVSYIAKPYKKKIILELLSKIL